MALLIGADQVANALIDYQKIIDIRSEVVTIGDQLPTINEITELVERAEAAAELSEAEYENKGPYNADTNTPTLSSDATIGGGEKPQKYIVEVSGLAEFPGYNFDIGDQLEVGDHLYEFSNGMWYLAKSSDEGYKLALELKKELEIGKPTINTVNGENVNGGIGSNVNRTITIPVGVTGHGTYLQEYILPSDYPEWGVDTKLRFTYIITESVPNTLHGDFPGFVASVQMNVLRDNVLLGDRGVVTGLTRISPVEVRLSVDYTLQSNDQRLQVFFRVFASAANAGTNPIVFTWNSLQVKVISPDNHVILNDLSQALYDHDKSIKKLRTDVNAIQAISGNILENKKQVEVGIPTDPSDVNGEQANGGFINTAARTITIPIGQTGFGTYLQEVNLVSDNPDWKIGTKLKFTYIVAESAPNLLQTSAPYIPSFQLNVLRDNLLRGDQGAIVPGIERISNTEVRFSLNYTIQSGDQNLIPFFRIHSNINNTPNPIVFTWKSLQVKVVTPDSQIIINDLSQTLYNHQVQLRTNTNNITEIQQLQELETDYYTPSHDGFNGGEAINGAIIDTTLGTFTIPVGTAGGGTSTYIYIWYPVDPSWKVGDLLTFRASIQENIPGTLGGVRYNLKYWTNVIRNGIVRGDQGFNQTKYRRLDVDDVMYITFDYILQEGDSEIRTYVAMSSDVNETGNTLVYKIALSEVKNHSPLRGSSTLAQQLNLRDLRIKSIESILANASTTVYVTVMKIGGQFNNITSALASIIDASASKRYVILVYPGIYTDYEWKVKKYISVIGTDRSTCIFQLFNPDDSTDIQISGRSNFWTLGHNTIANLTFRCSNARYNLHDDQPGSEDVVNYYYNCVFEHLGNQGAIAWRTAHPESGLLPQNVWAADRPIGKGSRSGAISYWRDCTFNGRIECFLIHNQLNFKTGGKDIFEGGNNIFISQQNFGIIAYVQSYGAGVKSVWDGGNIVTTPGIVYALGGSGGNWFSTLPQNQTSSHQEFEVTLPRLTAWIDVTEGVGLKIAATSHDKVRISGSAAPFIFGSVVERDGGVGAPGYVYGSYDIGAGSNSGNNTLGRRLGDCTTINKNLIITINNVDYEVVFNTNLTNVANATIMGSINTILGANGTVSTYNVSFNEYYPSLGNREAVFKNTGSTTIPRFSAVKIGVGLNSIAGMTGSDDPNLFIGITLEPIFPGKSGRVALECILFRNQMNGLAGPGTGPYGNNISVGATVGTYVQGNGCVIGRAVNGENAFFKGKENFFPAVLP